jgi:hypothetical protein
MLGALVEHWNRKELVNSECVALNEMVPRVECIRSPRSANSSLFWQWQDLPWPPLIVRRRVALGGRLGSDPF